MTTDTIQRFCHRAHFCTSAESAVAGTDHGAGILTVTTDEAFELERATNRLRRGSVVGRDPGTTV